MLVLVIMDTVVVALLAVVVAGLLRSHADILRALHSLGAGVGDPAARPRADADPEAAGPAPIHFGPPLPAERNASSAHDIDGVSPDGGALAIPVEHGERFTLLAFLSTGCLGCAGFWEALSSPDRHGLPTEVRPVIVTKGPELEIPADVQSLAPPAVTVVMSSTAWDDYEIPGSPFFVLVNGRTHRRAGEGVAGRFAQVAEMVRRALADDERNDRLVSRNSVAGGLDGAQREALNDRALMKAGIHPGHRSLYPTSLEEVFGSPPLEHDDRVESRRQL